MRVLSFKRSPASNARRHCLRYLAIVFALVASAAWAPAQALIILTVDPDHYAAVDADDYAAGTNVSDALSGARMSQVRQRPRPYDHETETSGPVPALERSDAIANGAWLGMGDSLGMSSLCGLGSSERFCLPYDALEIVFDSPTDFVQAGIYFNADGGSLWAFDAYGNVLARCHALSTLMPSSGAGCDSLFLGELGQGELLLSLARPGADIARVLVGGLDVTGGIFEFSYAYETHSVPEPGTLALFGLGLAGLGAARRRRTA